MPTVYVTAPADDAAGLARSVVEERLAACVNRFDCASTYRWEGEVVEESEVVLLMKTTEGRYDALVDHVVARHPHDVPCVERFDEQDVLAAFGAWVADSTTRDA
jgi:periplasmic divalent cation tolerance protein